MAFNIRCPNCKYEGPGTIKSKGSGIVGCALLFFFIIPGIIYFIWNATSRHTACPACGWGNVVITKGVADYSPGAAVSSDDDAKTVLRVFGTIGFFFALAIVLLIFVALAT